MMLRGLATAAGTTVCLLWGPRAGAGGPQGASYIGAKFCLACHKSANPEQMAGWAGSAHAQALWPASAADATRVIAADFSQGAPFARDQVAYVLGMGFAQQAYLDKDLQVLPGRWEVKDRKWIPQAPADGRVECLGCHATGYSPDTGQWKDPGVACESCHGPGSTHASATDKKATIVRPETLDPARGAMVCGRCHSNGRSSDGRYPFSTSYLPGGDLDASLKLTPGMPKGSQNDQYNELRLGGGKHLGEGVGCLACHDPHLAQPPSLRKQGSDLCLQCHAGKLTGAQHEPAALEKVGCTVCHMPGGRHTFALAGAN
jgi:predicted CXXCH cytochrome family protein